MEGSPVTVSELPTMLHLLKMKTMIPISKTVVKQASIYPMLRQLMINVGQFEHRLLTRMRNPGIDVKKIDPVCEEQAVEYAGDLAGELFYYGAWTVGVGAWFLHMDKKTRESQHQAKESRRHSMEAKELLETLASRSISKGGRN